MKILRKVEMDACEQHAKQEAAAAKQDGKAILKVCRQKYRQGIACVTILLTITMDSSI